MAEEAQQLTVVNTGQPIVVSINPAYEDEEPQALASVEPGTTIEIEISPADG